MTGADVEVRADMLIRSITMIPCFTMEIMNWQNTVKHGHLDFFNFGKYLH